jgi:outer membrane receptor protein involved in Fe transport
MKKILLIMGAVLMIAFGATAQFPGATGAKQGQQPPAIGHIYGKITDTTGAAINGASVVLLQNRLDTVTKKRKDVLLKGFTTKANGDFSFNDLPVFGPLKLKISAIGYKAFEQTVSFQMKMNAAAAPKQTGNDPAQAMSAMSSMMNAFDKDLGNIKLQADAKQLQAVTVVSNKSSMKLDIDKKVFNVDKNIVSAGGTALDVMRNVPSVQVDIDGNVALRNAAPQIYIDGRPTTLSLDQIPADAIESVEVITNPSAKYDASGGNAGILNIVLKKNKKSGYNGNLRTGVDKRGAVNAGGDFSVRQGKVNFTASAMINQNKSRTSGTTDRLNLFEIPQTSIYQTNSNKTSGGFMFGRIGMDYFITNRTTLSVGGVKVHGEFNPNEIININTDSLYSNIKKSSYSERLSTGTREFNAHGLQLGMKHLFPKEGEELTADLNYFSGKNGGNSLYVTNYFSSAGGSQTGQYQQQLINSGTNRFLTVQTDYVKPFKKIKLETGLRAQLRKLTNVNDNYVFNPSTNKFELLQSATSNYKNNDNVYAAYVSVSGNKKDFGYKLGLRAESSEYDGTLLGSNTKFSNSYPVSLFPSLFLSQKLSNKQEVQFSVTRRVNRPNFFQLIPFVDYTDNLNITKGNPDLKPEFTQSYEMSYSKTFQKSNNLLASVYYKKTTDLITRYQDKGINPITGAEILVNTFLNANSSQAYGAELTSINYLTKWWDISTNLNLYNSKINTNNINGTSQDAMWSWFGKFNSNFKLPSKYTVQLTATYQSKTNLPINTGGGGMGPGGPQQAQSSAQGYIKPSYGIDLAIKKSFLKNDAASVTFSVSDIFKTRIAEQYSYSNYFTQTYSRLRDPQMFRLNFSYRFGKMDMSLFKRKNTKTDMQGATDGMQQ